MNIQSESDRAKIGHILYDFRICSEKENNVIDAIFNLFEPKNIVNIMNVESINNILLVYRYDLNYTTEKAIEDICNLSKISICEQYTPYTAKDFNEFMYREVRRKGENFKNEICLIEGCAIDEGILITIPVNTDDYKTDTGFNSQWTSFSTALEEWEYLDGSKLGRVV